MPRIFFLFESESFLTFLIQVSLLSAVLRKLVDVD